MKILLTGIDGYCGWPLALALSKKFKNSKIIELIIFLEENGLNFQNQIAQFQ